MVWGKVACGLRGSQVQGEPPQYPLTQTPVETLLSLCYVRDRQRSPFFPKNLINRKIDKSSSD